MRFGAIDLGSNSVRCLAVRVCGGALEYIDSGAWITRLAEGIGGGVVPSMPSARRFCSWAVRAFL